MKSGDPAQGRLLQSGNHCVFAEGATAEDDKPIERRLCWWRDPEVEANTPFPEPQFSDPEARYRYERARAEEQFRSNFNLLETSNRENPPHMVIVSESIREVRTDARDELQIACSLETYVSQFLHHVLIAYGDLLLDKRTPASEALQAFEQHAEELLQQTHSRKWLFGLGRLELSEEAQGPRFWVFQKEVAQNVRHDFEELVWEAELEQVTTSTDGAEVEGGGRIPQVESALTGTLSDSAKAGETEPRPNEAEPAQPEKEGQAPDASHENPEVAKRRAIVRQNSGVRSEGLCQLFDNYNVPLPPEMKDAGTWGKAYKSPLYRPRIHVIISKDRKKSNHTP